LVFAGSVPIRIISSKICNNNTALITGAFAERIRFWAYLLFMVLFIINLCTLMSYDLASEGLFFKMGVLDFFWRNHMFGWAALANNVF
jgi:Amt family ammonium transporter